MSGGGMLGLGKSNSSNQSTSQGVSGSSSEGSSQQAIAFGDLYKQLYTGASGAASAGVANGDELGTQARQLFTGGTNFLSDLQDPNNAGTDYMEGRLNGSNPAMDAAIGNLGNEAARTFSQKLMPQITSSAVDTGTLGNDREGVAQGTAMGQVMQDFMTQAGNMQLSNVQQKDAMASTIAGNSLTAASTGLGALPSMMDLLTNSATPDLGIYANLAKVLGGPTVLTASQQLSNSFGNTQSQGSGKSSAWNFSMAGEGGAV